MAGKLAKVAGHILAIFPMLPFIVTQTGWDWYKEVANDLSENLSDSFNREYEYTEEEEEEERKSRSTIYWQEQYRLRKQEHSDK